MLFYSTNHLQTKSDMGIFTAIPAQNIPENTEENEVHEAELITCILRMYRGLNRWLDNLA
jgi:hypothetical protein